MNTFLVYDLRLNKDGHKGNYSKMRYTSLHFYILTIIINKM